MLVIKFIHYEIFFQTTGVDLPDDLSDLQDSAEIISLLMQLLNPDPLE